MNGLLKSWKTTAAGVASILAAGALLLQAVSDGGLTGETIAEVIALMTAGIGLLTARDADKSSQDHGVRR